MLIVAPALITPTPIYAKTADKYKTYQTYSSKTFKSYEDAQCITSNTSIAQGRLKKKYKLDPHTGIYTVNGRYCVALGSYFTKKIGVKVDLILSYKNKKHIVKCITADSKADRDTINNHRVHKDGSVAEFVVNTRSLSAKTRLMGDISYSSKKFKGKIVAIRVYKK